MTVQELIELLQRFPGNSTVEIRDDIEETQNGSPNSIEYDIDDQLVTIVAR